MQRRGSVFYRKKKRKGKEKASSFPVLSLLSETQYNLFIAARVYFRDKIGQSADGMRAPSKATAACFLFVVPGLAPFFEYFARRGTIFSPPLIVFTWDSAFCFREKPFCYGNFGSASGGATPDFFRLEPLPAHTRFSFLCRYAIGLSMPSAPHIFPLIFRRVSSSFLFFSFLVCSLCFVGSSLSCTLRASLF